MAYQLTPESISRAAFLRSLCLSTTALSSLYFQACSKRADLSPIDPVDGANSTAVVVGNADPNAGKIDFTIDLTKPDNAKLATVGQFVTAGGVVVANSKAGHYVALLNECSHDGGPLWYRLSQNDFRCQWHGGLFTINGSVKGPPPTRPQQLLSTMLSADKNTLHITE